MSRRNDLSIYEDEAAMWWIPGSKAFRSLRALNAQDFELIRAEWGERLGGARVADLGCGGGYLALDVAGLGAEVTGVDLSAASLAAAHDEARRRGLDVRFVRADVADCQLESGAFGFVLLHDVLEHVDEPALVVREAARLLRPGGSLFASTIDRGFLATLQVVWLAESLGLVPRGTHDPRMFLRPSELEGLAREAGLRTLRTLHRKPDLWGTLRARAVRLRDAESGPIYVSFLVKDPAVARIRDRFAGGSRASAG